MQVDSFCVNQRAYTGECGIEGKWFMPKERDITPVEPKGQKFGPFTLIAPEPTPKRHSLLSRLFSVFVKRGV